MEFFEVLKKLVDPESIIHYGGLALLLFVIFAETGLFVGFFLPGDSLVFIAGVICVSKPQILGVGITELMIYLMLAAIIGNIAGYWFGYKVGERLFQKKDSFIFKKKYVEVTKEFYARNGGKTLIIGRFLPIIRTFAPILAGVLQIDFKKFMLYNVVGAMLWIGTFTGIGYYLGTNPWVQKNIGLIVLLLIVITIIPIIKTYVKEKRRRS